MTLREEAEYIIKESIRQVMPDEAVSRALQNMAAKESAFDGSAALHAAISISIIILYFGQVHNSERGAKRRKNRFCKIGIDI